MNRRELFGFLAGAVLAPRIARAAPHSGGLLGIADEGPIGSIYGLTRTYYPNLKPIASIEPTRPGAFGRTVLLGSARQAEPAQWSLSDTGGALK